MAGSASGALRCGHLTFWGPASRGGEGPRGCGDPGPGLLAAGELQRNGGVCMQEAKGRPHTASLRRGSEELVVSWWL